jgi:disulfide bond formation protein DsbB
MTLDDLLTPRNTALVVLAGAVATIAGAWGFQLIGNLAPCPLCLEQRWSWYVAIPVLLLALTFVRSDPKGRLMRGLLAVSGAIILAGGALGAYHAGVEWGFWQGPTACSGGPGLDTSAGLPSLSNAIVIRCDEAPWRLLGISLAGYNALISFALAGLAFRAARRG